MLWFDAHLDLAYLAVNGRDMAAPLDPAAQPHPPASVTLPALAAGNVRACLGTIFTESGGSDASGYPAGDAEAAHAAGLRQLECYQQWAASGLVRLSDRRAGHSAPLPLRSTLPLCHSATLPLSLGILIECADPIRTPDELDWWAERSVVAIGLAWARGSRYAGGNSAPSSDTGLTDLGRALVRRMDELEIVHDVSHLSDRALADLLSSTDRPVIASHSNCRALMGDDNQRHLTDDAIREIARRGGVIGLNLFSAFLRPGITPQKPARAALADAVRHVDHICELVGDREHVGLGSDMDGGFGASILPEGIDSPSDLHRLAEAFSAAGWPDEDIARFGWGNWVRFWGIA